LEYKDLKEEKKVTSFLKDEFDLDSYWIGLKDLTKPEKPKVSLSSSLGSHLGRKCVDNDKFTTCDTWNVENFPWILLEYSSIFNISEITVTAIISSPVMCSSQRRVSPFLGHSDDSLYGSRVLLPRRNCDKKFENVTVRVTKDKPDISSESLFLGGSLMGTYSGDNHGLYGHYAKGVFDDQVISGRYVVIQMQSRGRLSVMDISVKSSHAREFVWSFSGTSVENSYTNWNNGEPKIEDMEEDCVTHSNEGWATVQCSTLDRYVCKFDPQNEMSLEGGFFE